MTRTPTDLDGRAPRPPAGLDAPLADRYDVVVAGSRCAGAATALLLARRGLSVLVVDPVPPSRDALSTHALMRGGVLQLLRWGLLEGVVGAGTPPVRSTVFHYGDETVPIPIKPADGVDALYAPRRTVLDPLLARAAEEAGARVVHGLSVVGLLWGPGGRVRGAVVQGRDGEPREVRAGVVVGADGVRSRVARLVDAPVEHRAAHAAAVVYGYWPGLEPGAYHWYFERTASAGAIPTNDGDTCVFVGMPAADFPRLGAEGLTGLHHRLLGEAAPNVAEALEGVEPRGKLRAFPGIPGFLRRSAGPGWALVGDAGYFKDPATAHGITDALRDAELLARAVEGGGERSLLEYHERREALVTGFMDVTDRIASFESELDEVKGLHLALSREMNRGVDAIRELDGGATEASAGGQGADRRDPPERTSPPRRPSEAEPLRSVAGR